MNSFSVVAVISANISKYQKAMQEVLGATNQLKDLTLSNTEMMGQSFKTVGKALTLGLTAPLTGIGIKSVKTAAEFEAGMSKVKAISGATGTEFKQLEALAKEMGATTKFTAIEAAEALKYMGMAGWKPKQMMAGLAPVMNLAAASGENLGLVSDIVTDSLTAFGLTANDASRYVDVLAATATNSNTNVGLMGDTFKYVAPVAGALGYSVEDTALAIGLMANQGIKGSQAGTALRSAFTRLVKPTKEVHQGLAMIGLSADDFKNKSLHETIDILRNSFDGLDESQQAQAAAMIFGQRAMSGMLGIINTSEEDFNKLANAINNSSGAAEEMAAIMMDNLQGDLILLKSAVEGAAIAIGEQLRPYIRDVTQKIKEWVDAFNQLDPQTQEMIVKIGLFAAAIGPLVWILGSFLENIRSVAKGIDLLGDAFGLLANPIGLAIAAILAIVGTIVYLWNTNEEFRSAVIAIWTAISEFFSQTWEAIKTTATGLWEGVQVAWSGFTDWVSATWGALKEFFANLWDGIKETASNLWNTVQEKWAAFKDWAIETWTGLKESILDIWNSIKDNVEGIWEGIKSIAESVWELIKIAILTPMLLLLQVLTGDWEGAKNSLSQIWEKTKSNASNIWNGIKQVINNLTELVINLAKKLWENAKQSISIIWENLKRAASDKFGQIKTTITNKVNEAKTSAVNKFNEMKSNVITAISTMLSTVRNKISELPRTISSAFQRAVSAGRRFISNARSVGADLIGGFVQGVKNTAHRLINAVTGAVGNAINGAKRLLGIRSPSRVFREIGVNTMLGAAIGIEDEAKAPIKAVQGVTEDMIGSFNDSQNNFNSNFGNMSANANITHTMSNNSNQKQPVNITFKMFDKTFKAFVDDITIRQNQVIELREGGF